MCSLKDTQCIQHCNCLGFTLRCVSVIHFEDNFFQNFYFTSLHVMNSSDMFIKTIMLKIKYTFILKLNKNNLTAVCIILPSLRRNFVVDFSFNLIEKIISGCFQNAPYLAEVKLNHNILSIISCKAFGNLPSLTILDLSYNRVKYISFLSILNSPNLVSLNIQKNNLQDYSSKIDLPLNVKVQIVLTDEYYLCCISSTITKCLMQGYTRR